MPEFTVEDLARKVAERAGSGASDSYTAALARKGVPHCARKLGEEAVEAVIAAASGDREGLRYEAADVLYHLLVLLHVAGVPFSEVTAELQRRTAETGLQEKAARGAS
jgi:phosphoribosyl-ATP pyrophosphohydrolase